MTEQTVSGQAADGDVAPIRFETKIAVLLREDLQVWQRLNVCAFLDERRRGGQSGDDRRALRGRGRHRVPVDVPAAGGGAGGRQGDCCALAHGRALDRALSLAVYTEDLFLTGNDRDNRAAVRAVPRESLNLVGASRADGKRNAVDKVMKGAVDASR